MRRREFITLLGSPAVAWPLVAKAQQGRVRRIGVMVGYAAGDPEAQIRIAVFQEGLAKLGWLEGQNLRIDYRWSAADPDRMRTYAAELVSLKPT